MLTDYEQSFLFLSSNNSYSQSFLFYIATYWAQKGRKVEYVSPVRISKMPLSIGAANKLPNPEVFSQIRFMYLPNGKELLRHLSSTHLQNNPPSVLIVEQLETYCNNEEPDSLLVCAALVNAASICALKTKLPSVLLGSYSSSGCMILRSMVINFFKNIWRLEVIDDGEGCGSKNIELFNLASQQTVFRFHQEDDTSDLVLKEVFKCKS